jgi:type IV pilus assembly protein PilA
MLLTLRNRKGVTLVELLAVIVILGIITAIAVPTIGNLIERQRQNAAEASFTAIEEAARLYAVDATGSTFSLADLITEEYISDATLTLFTDALGAEAVTSTDIFVIGVNDAVTIDLPGAETTLYLKVGTAYYLVYTA